MSSSGAVSLANQPQLATKILRKTIDMTTLLVASNTLVTISAAGLVRLESLTAVLPVAATSGGAATLDLQIQGQSIMGAPAALAALAINNQLKGATAGCTFAAGRGPDPALANSIGGAVLGPLILNAAASGVALAAVVGVAVYTAGTLTIVAVYTPLSVGATLT